MKLGGAPRSGERGIAAFLTINGVCSGNGRRKSTINQENYYKLNFKSYTK